MSTPKVASVNAPPPKPGSVSSVTAPYGKVQMIPAGAVVNKGSDYDSQPGSVVTIPGTGEQVFLPLSSGLSATSAGSPGSAPPVLTSSGAGVSLTGSGSVSGSVSGSGSGSANSGYGLTQSDAAPETFADWFANLANSLGISTATLEWAGAGAIALVAIIALSMGQGGPKK